MGSEGRSTVATEWTYTLRVGRNTVGGGYFRIATLYRDGRRYARHAYDGTLWRGYADRRALKKIREWRDIYGAEPR